MEDLDTIYKALRLVPDFDGNPNILPRFIKLCDQLAIRYCTEGSSDLNKCALINGILNKVVGPAARLINANGIPVDWQGIRSALINNFTDQRDETALYNDLALLKQGSSTPQEYYERCQNLFGTIMTYVTLHDTIQTTVDSKRDLYKKLTLQAFVRGLNDPLGSRIRCMRPESIEKALEYVHEEVNILYMQSRNERLPEKKILNPALNNLPSGVKTSIQPFSMPVSRPFNYSMPGPSRPHFATQNPQWRPNFNYPHQFGPTRTQQIFKAPPPNYNPQNNNFQLAPRSNQYPRPMSGVSHYVSRQLPQIPALTGHDWRKFGNPGPSNYFKTRETNYNYCMNEQPVNEYYADYSEPYYDSYEFVDYQHPHEYESIPVEYNESPQTSQIVEDTSATKSNEQDFQKIQIFESVK